MPIVITCGRIIPALLYGSSPTAIPISSPCRCHLMILGLNNSAGQRRIPRQRVHPNRSRCSSQSGIGNVQSRRRISRPEPSTSHGVLASRLCYFGYPCKIGLSSTREHGWMYRVIPHTMYTTRQTPLDLHNPADAGPGLREESFGTPSPNDCRWLWARLSHHGWSWPD